MSELTISHSGATVTLESTSTPEFPNFEHENRLLSS